MTATGTVAVLGGGISGLAAAWELAATGDHRVVVLEAGDRPGGKIHTSPFLGRPVDEAADAFLRRVPWALDLCAELGIDDTLVSPAERRAYIWSRGALRPLPRRHVLGVPVDADDLAETGLVADDRMGEVRTALAEPFVLTDDDISVGDLVRGAAGAPVLDAVVGPLVGGINAGDADAMSAEALTPQLAAAARRPDGLIASLRDQLDDAAARGEEAVFSGWETGTDVLVDALVSGLRDRGVEIRTGTAATALTETDGGVAVTTAGARLEADAAVLAVPAFAAASLLTDPAPDVAAGLGDVNYASVVLVTLAVERADVSRPLDASGFLVPHAEGLLLTACSWASTKWAHLDDGRHAILRASAGSATDDRPDDLDDEALVARLIADLTVTMDLDGEPTAVRVSRWPRSLPQYGLGHVERVTDLRHGLAEAVPHLELAGAAYDGVGIPACIHSGRQAARRLLA